MWYYFYVKPNEKLIIVIKSDNSVVLSRANQSTNPHNKSDEGLPHDTSAYWKLFLNKKQK